MYCMRAWFAALCLSLSLVAAPVTGCAVFAPQHVNAVASGLDNAATALRLLNVVAEKQINDLGSPTPEQLELAASVVRDIQDARHELELAQHDYRAEEYDAARDHARTAVLKMRGACDTLRKLGAGDAVKSVEAVLRYAEQML